jgi:hypothetical protein
MSRSTLGVASLLVLTFSLPIAAQSGEVPRNIELKPGAAAAEAATPATPPAATTRQIVTEGKDGAPAGAVAPAAAGVPATPAGAPPADATPADATPADAAQGPPPGAVPPGPGEIVFAVQTELKRVGCDPGEIDGVWGGRSREALAAFGHFAKVDVATLEPTPEIFVIIKGKGALVCQAAAGPAEVDEAEPAAAAAPAPPPHHGYGGGGGGY